MHRVDLSRIRAKGLYYLPSRRPDGHRRLPGPIGRRAARRLVAVEPGEDGGRHGAGRPRTWRRRRRRARRPCPRRSQQSRQPLPAKDLLAALAGRDAYQSPWPDMSPLGRAPWTSSARAYLLANDGRLGFVLLRFTQKDEENFAQNSDAVDLLRAIVDHAKTRHPGVKIGLTGLPVMENDEMRLSQSAMTLVTFLSLGGVFLVLVAGFGCLRHSLMATAVLLLGTMWTVGYTAVTVGYLNILSIAFGSILMGLGINYGIYYVARYLAVVRDLAIDAPRRW